MPLLGQVRKTGPAVVASGFLSTSPSLGLFSEDFDPAEPRMLGISRRLIHASASSMLPLQPRRKGMKRYEALSGRSHGAFTIGSMQQTINPLALFQPSHNRALRASSQNQKLRFREQTSIGAASLVDGRSIP